MEPMRVIDSDDMPMEQVEQALAGCRFALMGIRINFPSASEEECLERLRQRLAWSDELHEPVHP